MSLPEKFISWLLIIKTDMDVNTIKAVYFVGIGGIGMSALARYFLSKGKRVGGYDRVSSELTEKLAAEGAQIHYEENVSLIPEEFLDSKGTLVVYTPAVPSAHRELEFFKEHQFEIQKRAQVLGMLTRTEKGLCVAGTHGSVPCGMQCFSGRHFEKLWNQSAAFVRERLCGNRGR